METDRQTIEQLMQEIATLRQQNASLEQQVAASKQAEEQLVEAQRFFQLIIDNIPQAIFWKDRNLVYQGCNQTFARNAGLSSPSEIVGKNAYDLTLRKDDVDTFRQDDLRVMQENVPYYHVSRLQFQDDGQPVWLDTNRIPLHDADGHVIGILGTYEDITERQQMQEDLQASEERFRTLIEAIRVGILIHQDNVFRYTNPAAEQITGYTPEEMVHMTFEQLIHPDDLGTVMERAAARHRGEDVPERYEIKIIRKDGEERWVDISNRVILFDKKPSIIVTALDITLHKQLEQTLRSRERQFRSLLDTIAVATWIHRGQQIMYANLAAQTFFGYSAEDFCDMSFLDIIHPEDRELVRQRAEARQRGETIISRYEIRTINRQGQTLWVFLSASHIEFEGAPSIVVTAYDVTERKRAEDERAALQEQVITAQRAALRELSTPLIPLADQVIALPIIGSIDSARAQQIMETLLQGVADYQSDIAILDITGVPIIDTQVAHALIQTAQAVRLLGAQVVLTGVGPAMAQTLVTLGADLGGITPLRTLQQGILYAINRHQNRPTRR